jgi:hypothetical protein
VKFSIDETREGRLIPSYDHTEDRPVSRAVSDLDVIVAHVSPHGCMGRWLVDNLERSRLKPSMQYGPRIQNANPENTPDYQYQRYYLVDKSRMRFQPSLQFLSGSRIDEITDFR